MQEFYNRVTDRGSSKASSTENQSSNLIPFFFHSCELIQRVSFFNPKQSYWNYFFIVSLLEYENHYLKIFRSEPLLKLTYCYLQ